MMTHLVTVSYGTLKSDVGAARGSGVVSMVCFDQMSTPSYSGLSPLNGKVMQMVVLGCYAPVVAVSLWYNIQVFCLCLYNCVNTRSPPK